MQACVGNLLALEVPQVEQLQAVGLVAFQIGDAAANRIPVVERRRDGRVVAAGEGVQQRQARCCVEGQHGFVLRVNHGQIRRQLFQDGNRCRLIVDEDAAFAAGRDLAAQDDLAVFGVDAVFFQDAVDRGRADIEYRRDGGFFGAVADCVAGGFVAQQQGQCVDEDGFSGAGFAGKQVET